MNIKVTFQELNYWSAEQLEEVIKVMRDPESMGPGIYKRTIASTVETKQIPTLIYCTMYRFGEALPEPEPGAIPHVTVDFGGIGVMGEIDQKHNPEEVRRRPLPPYPPMANGEDV